VVNLTRNENTIPPKKTPNSLIVVIPPVLSDISMHWIMFWLQKKGNIKKPATKDSNENDKIKQKLQQNPANKRSSLRVNLTHLESSFLKYSRIQIFLPSGMDHEDSR
jgi:hypothetical protein